MMNVNTPKVIVIGGGIGGLAAAVELAAHGCSVRLFEAHNTIGGKIRQTTIAGKTIDIGPTVLTMRWVFEQIFRDVGCNLEEKINLQPATRVASHAWDDGSQLDLFFDVEETREAIRVFAGSKEADGYWAFTKYTKKIYDNAYPTFMTSPDPSVLYMARHAGPKAMGTVFHIDPFRKMVRALKSFFHDPRLIQLFARYATYYGSSPYMAPATLNLISFVEQQGVWLPRDGMGAIARALSTLAQEFGVEIICNAPVSKIKTRRGRVNGVELSDSTFHKADVVVYNGDIQPLGNGNLGEDVKSAVSPTKTKDRSLAALVGALVARTDGFTLASHNVFFHTTPYEQEFRDIFKKGRLPAHPTVYVRAQDRDIEPLCSREERLFFIINSPPRGDTNPLTQEEISRCIDSAMTLFKRVGLTISFPQENLRLFSPNDFAKQFPGTGGALYGPSTHSMWASLKRSGVRSKVPGLYLAGGSVHPGAGVPMAALGGRHAATCVLQDQGLTALSPLTAIPGGTSTA